jgi:hypothetical protein
MLSGMSEPSFLDWYPRGRLAFLASKQSNDLKSRIDLSESIASALLIFIKVKSELQTILDAWSISENNGDLPSFKPPSVFHISPGPQDSSSSQISEASRSCLSLTDYVCRFSGEFFPQLVQHPIFQKALVENPALVGLSGSPILIFDRAIYAIDLGEGADQLMIESSFPPAQLDPSLESQELPAETIFINSLGVTSALIERDGILEVLPVAGTRPVFSKLSDENRNSIINFFQEKALALVRLLETQTLIIGNLSDYFISGFESSVHLLNNREALWPVSVDVIES